METRTLLLLEDGRELSWEVTWEGPVVEVVESVDGVESDVARHVLSTSEVAAFVRREIDARLSRGWIEREEGPSGPVAINEDLEAMIRADPEAEEPYLVYGDWLEARGDPRGELIAMHHARMSEAAEQLMRRRPDYFLGDLANVIEAVRIEWRLGFIRSALIAPPRDAGDPAHMTAVTLRRLLTHHSSRFMRRLEIQRFEDQADYGETIEGMIELGFPATLIELAIGRLHLGGAPVASKLPRLGEALARAPHVERVVIRGGSFYTERSLDLTGISLPAARSFELRTDHLPEEAIEAIAGASWPRLETLIFTGRVPAEPIAAMLEEKSFPLLAALDLSGSELSNDDAQVILQSSGFRALRELRLPRAHRFLDENAAKLRSLRNVQFVDHATLFIDAYEDENELDEDAYEPDLYSYEEDEYWDSDEYSEDIFDSTQDRVGYDDEDPW